MSSSASPGELRVGSRLGRFLILEQIGRGGMGVVFRAREENLGREVALKVIAPHYAHDPDFRDRFTREAQSQASLDSAHVVAIYAHGEEAGYLYIASQLVADGDLGNLIRTAGVPPIVNALEVIEQIASGLADAHDAGLVHRDIKPGNVLVRIRGGVIRAYLCDFGIARRVGAAATRFSSSTVGTPSYMAPELHDGVPASAATDIYSLGCLLWVALTGAPPYQGVTDFQVIGAHLHDPVPQLAGDAAMVQATNRILRTAMAKDPDERYESAAGMRDDLQAALRMPVHTGGVTPRGSGTTTPGATALRPRTPTPTPTPGPAPGPTPGPTPSSHPTPAPGGWSSGIGGGSGSPGAGGSGGGGVGAAGPASGRRWWLLGAAAGVTAVGVGIGAAVLTDRDPSPDPTPTVPAFAESDPKDIVDAAEKEMSVLDSARVTGSFTDDSGEVEVDLIATSIGNCEGTMTLADSGARAEFRSVERQIYLRPDAAYWEAVVDGDTTAVREAVGDRWLQDNSLRSSLNPVCDLDRFLERDGREDAVATTEGTEEIDGDDTVKVTQREGSSSETLFVRIDEPHYLVRLLENGRDVFEFSEFDAEVDITAPSADEIFDMQEYLAENGG